MAGKGGDSKAQAASSFAKKGNEKAQSKAGKRQ